MNKHFYTALLFFFLNTQVILHQDEVDKNLVWLISKLIWQ